MFASTAKVGLMDSTISYNKERWEDLSAANVQYAVPFLNLNADAARKIVDPEGQLSQIQGLEVLCLAAGGGQQSAAFGLLGARVCVFDLSENQLEKDRLAARHYGFSMQTFQGDMQDLSALDAGAFDIVWLAHSINFVPDARKVIRQIERVCKQGGRVRLHFTNPYVHGTWVNPMGNGFLITQPYIEGEEIQYTDRVWNFADPSGQEKKVAGPKEYRHTLSTIINTLIENGLRVDGFWEETEVDPTAKVGSWEHFKSIAPPWLIVWATKDGRKGLRAT
jgi:ubiquinone/menaquinone biosynthesis C-methylase UbiE